MLKGLLWTTFNESFVEIHISSSKRNVFEKVISKLVVILVRPQWRHMSGSTLVQVMACCLMALSHHLNQCWLIKEILRHSQRANVLFEYSKYQSRIWVWNLYFLNHSQIREQRVDSKHAFFFWQTYICRRRSASDFRGHLSQTTNTLWSTSTERERESVGSVSKRRRSEGLCYLRPINPVFKLVPIKKWDKMHVGGWVQDCSISITNALDILQSYTKPSI